MQIPKGFSVNEEIELGVVIGKQCKAVPEHKVMDVVVGYCLALDMTATCKLVSAFITKIINEFLVLI